MAIQYSVNEARPGTGAFEGTGSAIRSQQRKVYNIEVTDDADPNYDGKDIDPAEVLNAPGLPIANETAYSYTDTSGDVMVEPYNICTTKRVQRNPINNRIWVAECLYTSASYVVPEKDLQPQPINAAVDGYQKLVFQLTSETSFIRDVDQTEPTAKQCKLPTGNYYTEPFTERISKSSFTIVQNEVDHNELQFAEAAADNRRYKINELGWAVPNRANRNVAIHYGIISSVQCKQVRIPVTTDPSGAIAFQFTYVIDVLDENYKPGGWDSRRALIDAYYLEAAGDTSTRVLFWDGRAQSYVKALLNADGTKKADQDGDPTFETYQVQPHIDFNLFL